MKGWLILGVTFLIGVILGVTAATHGPALVAPYLPRAVARSQTRIDGQVVRKQRDGNRLLVKVDTGQGPMLVTFTQKVADAVLESVRSRLSSIGRWYVRVRVSPVRPTAVRIRSTQSSRRARTARSNGDSAV